MQPDSFAERSAVKFLVMISFLVFQKDDPFDGYMVRVIDASHVHAVEHDRKMILQLAIAEGIHSVFDHLVDLSLH